MPSLAVDKPKVVLVTFRNVFLVITRSAAFRSLYRLVTCKNNTFDTWLSVLNMSVLHGTLKPFTRNVNTAIHLAIDNNESIWIFWNAPLGFIVRNMLYQWCYTREGLWTFGFSKYWRKNFMEKSSILETIYNHKKKKIGFFFFNLKWKIS